MTSDEENEKERERQRLLGDIRRRAEEAELKRIEQEEQESASSLRGDEEEPPGVVAASDEGGPAEVPKIPEAARFDEEQIIVLREQLTIAIDHRDGDRANDLFLQIAKMISGTLELAAFERKLKTMQEELARTHPRPETAKPQVAEEEEQRRQEARKKKINGLMEKSISLYERESYDKALEAVQEVLALDVGHEDAVELQKKIGKAKDLADLIRRQDEERRSAAAAEQTLPEETKRSGAGASGDIWGERAVRPQDEEFGVPVEHEAPPRPKFQAAKEFAEQASRIRIPLRPVLTVLAVATVVAAGYVVYQRILDGAAVLSNSILVPIPVTSPADSVGSAISYVLCEQLIGRLAAVPDLRVIAAPSALSARKMRGGLTSAVQRLDVRYSLDWSLMMTADGVAFTLALRDTSAAGPIWTNSMQSSIRELPTALAEITRAVVAAMELEVAESTGTQSGLTANPDAYLRYLQASSLLASQTPDRSSEATGLLRQVIEVDKSFSVARVCLAHALLLSYWELVDPPDSILSEASFHVKDVLTSGYQSYDGYKVIGMVEQIGGRYDKARDFLERAIELAPGDAESYRLLSRLYVIAGMPDEALHAARRAQELDPLNPDSYSNLALVYQYSNEPEEALRVHRAGLVASDDHEQYAVEYFPELLVALQEHDSAEAILAGEVARSREDYVAYYRLGRVLQAAGRPKSDWEGSFQRTRDLIVRKLEARPNDHFARSYLALAYTRLGRNREAAAETEKALRGSRPAPAILYNTARVFAIQRDSAAAMEYLGTAVERRFDLQAILDMDFYNLRIPPDFFAKLTK